MDFWSPEYSLRRQHYRRDFKHVMFRRAFELVSIIFIFFHVGQGRHGVTIRTKFTILCDSFCERLGRPSLMNSASWVICMTVFRARMSFSFFHIFVYYIVRSIVSLDEDSYILISAFWVDFAREFQVTSFSVLGRFCPKFSDHLAQRFGSTFGGPPRCLSEASRRVLFWL